MTSVTVPAPVAEKLNISDEPMMRKKYGAEVFYGGRWWRVKPYWASAAFCSGLIGTAITIPGIVYGSNLDWYQDRAERQFKATILLSVGCSLLFIAFVLFCRATNGCLNYNRFEHFNFNQNTPGLQTESVGV